MAIAPVLKTGARKGLGVRIPHPPSTAFVRSASSGNGYRWEKNERNRTP